jgi:hypothetical protein
VRQPGWFRLMRSGVFASVCVVLSAVGHDLMASGRTPLWAGFAALGVLVPIGYLLAGRRRSALGLLLSVEAVQFGLHALFSWATPAPVPGMAGMVSHSSSGAGMFGVHALAGALVAGWLYVGDRALWWALSVLVEPVRRACAVLIAAPCRFWLVVGGVYRAREAGPLVVLRHVVARRGPPAQGFVLASP